MQPVDKYKYAAKLANKSMQSVDKYKATSKQIQVCDQQTYTTKRLGDKGESSWFDKDSDGELEHLTETAACRNPPLQSQPLKSIAVPPPQIYGLVGPPKSA